MSTLVRVNSLQGVEIRILTPFFDLRVQSSSPKRASTTIRSHLPTQHTTVPYKIHVAGHALIADADNSLWEH